MNTGTSKAWISILLFIALVLATPRETFAETYMCGGDFNSDGFADTPGEVSACAERWECPLGNFPCTNGSCTENGACSQVAADVFRCSTDGSEYSTVDECQNSCPSRTQSCNQLWECPFGGLPCIDIDNPANVTKTQADMTYYRNDGAVTDEGCEGPTFVFNGRPRECRPVGYRTSYSDCCGSQGSGCSTSDVETVAENSEGKCRDIGAYCKEYWSQIGCVQRGDVHCCFNSVTAKVFHEQGRLQLMNFPNNGDWGIPLSANCRGFTAEEFSMIDFMKLNLGDYMGQIQQEAINALQQEHGQKVNEIIQ